MKERCEISTNLYDKNNSSLLVLRVDGKRHRHRWKTLMVQCAAVNKFSGLGMM